MQTVEDIVVNEASYLRDHILLVTFSDGTTKEVDFSPFLNSTKAEYLKEYLYPEKFKSFQIEDGNIIWGEDADLIFPIEDLYTGKV